LAPQESRQTMAIIGVESGFEWILHPPPEPKRANANQQAEQEKPDEAPSLLKGSSPQ
jgi:hypothetical protein